MDSARLSPSQRPSGSMTHGPLPPDQTLLPSHLSAKARAIVAPQAQGSPPAPGASPIDTFDGRGDPWITLDAAGTLFRTRASTLHHVPSVLQCAVDTDGPWKPADLTQPIPVDVDGSTFAHVLDFLRYLRLKKGLAPSILTRITQAARRLGMESLETEAKYIYPLRQEKTAAKLRTDDWSHYYVYFRECWIRGTVLDRQALRHKVGKATRFVLTDSGQRRCDRTAQRGLNGKDSAMYAVCLIEFADFMHAQAYGADAEREFAYLSRWITRLPEGSTTAQAMRALLNSERLTPCAETSYRARCLALLEAG